MESTDGYLASEAGRPVLLEFDDMPQGFQFEGNQWVLHGFRAISGSIRASLHTATWRRLDELARLSLEAKFVGNKLVGTPMSSYSAVRSQGCTLIWRI